MNGEDATPADIPPTSIANEEMIANLNEEAGGSSNLTKATHYAVRIHARWNIHRSPVDTWLGMTSNSLINVGNDRFILFVKDNLAKRIPEVANDKNRAELEQMLAGMKEQQEKLMQQQEELKRLTNDPQEAPDSDVELASREE